QCVRPVCGHLTAALEGLRLRNHRDTKPPFGPPLITLSQVVLPSSTTVAPFLKNVALLSPRELQTGHIYHGLIHEEFFQFLYPKTVVTGLILKYGTSVGQSADQLNEQKSAQLEEVKQASIKHIQEANDSEKSQQALGQKCHSLFGVQRNHTAY
ncbi:hypothetical protein HPG69_010401, partial [Diceros bicornis minor]